MPIFPLLNDEKVEIKAKVKYFLLDLNLILSLDEL